MIYGESDDFGEAGILTHIMNVEEIAQAILLLAQDEERRLRMGENGYKRLMSKYRIEDMKETYQKIYAEFAKGIGLEWTEDKFTIVK